MSGMVGWSPGNQSAGPKPSEICCRVKLSVLPGTCLVDVSAGGAGGAGAPAGRATGIAYAHAGGSPAAWSTPVAMTAATPRTTRTRNLRMCSLRWSSTFCRGRPVRSVIAQFFRDVADANRAGLHDARVDAAQVQCAVLGGIDELHRVHAEPFHD